MRASARVFELFRLTRPPATTQTQTTTTATTQADTTSPTTTQAPTTTTTETPTQGKTQTATKTATTAPTATTNLCFYACISLSRLAPRTLDLYPALRVVGGGDVYRSNSAAHRAWSFNQMLCLLDGLAHGLFVAHVVTA